MTETNRTIPLQDHGTRAQEALRLCARCARRLAQGLSRDGQSSRRRGSSAACAAAVLSIGERRRHRRDVHGCGRDRSAHATSLERNAALAAGDERRIASRGAVARAAARERHRLHEAPVLLALTRRGRAAALDDPRVAAARPIAVDVARVDSAAAPAARADACRGRSR